MAQVYVDTEIMEHDKINNLADTLKITNAEAVGLIVCLWTWASTNAPNGNITNYSPHAIEKAVMWQNKRGMFFEAICSPNSQFVVRSGDELRLQDYETPIILTN